MLYTIYSVQKFQDFIIVLKIVKILLISHYECQAILFKYIDKDQEH